MPTAFEFHAPESIINTTTANDQYAPVLTALEGGGYVAVWTSYGQDGSGDGIYARLFDAQGTAAGAEFRINATTPGDQYAPAASALAGGGFVVAWTANGQDGDGDGIYARRFDAAGQALGGEWRANATTAGDQYAPVVSALADGGFVIGWTGNDSDWSGVSAQRYDASGIAQGGEIRVNDTQASDQYFVSIAGLGGGGFVATWADWGQDGDGDGIYARRFHADGSANGAEFRVNSFTQSDQYSPTVAALAGGGFVIAWTSWDQDSDGEGVFAQLYSAAGTAVGEEFRVNAQTADDQYQPAIAALADGGFMIGYSSDDAAGGSTIYAQRFNAQGAAMDSALPISSGSGTTVQSSSLAVLAGGTIAFSWMGYGRDGSGWGVEGRQLFPVASPIPALTGPQAVLAHGAEDSTYTISAASLLTGFTGAPGDTLSVVNLTATDATLTANANGTWTVSPAQDFNGTVTFSYAVANSQGQSAPATLALVIDAVNDVPVLADVRATLDNGTEDNGYIVDTADLIQGYEDVDGDTLAIAAITANRGTVASLGGGEWLITPQADYNGNVVLSYTITDGNGGNVSTSLSFVLDAVNDAPRLTGTQAALAHGTEDTPYTVSSASLLQGYTDVEGSAVSFSALTADHGLVTNLGNGTWRITPDSNYNGIMTLSYNVSDSGGASVAATRTYIVDPVPDSPNSIDMLDGTVAEMAANGTAVATFVGHNVDGAAMTYALTSNAGGRFTINAASGVMTVSNGSLLDYETAQGHSVTVRATTSSGLSFSQSFIVRVANVVENQTRTLTSSADSFVAVSDDNWNIDAGSGNDVIQTMGGADTIRGNRGNDTILAGNGNDVITFRSTSDGYDSIDGGGGNDTILALASSTVIGLSAIANVETISAGGFTGVSVAGTANADRLDFSGTTLIGITGIDAGRGNDTVIGTAGADTIRGNRGNDSIVAGDGNDVITFSETNDGYDYVAGGNGSDTLLALASGTAISLTGLSGIETISSNGFSGVYVRGSSGAEALDFTGVALSGITRIDGGSGNDTITGSSGADTIRGGRGADVLSGGAGRDVFLFNATSDSRSSSGIDTITDFVAGLDKINLSAIDASSRASNDQAFSFIGSAAFHKIAGELRTYYDTANARTVIQGDINGDGFADIQIHLTGNVLLSSTDFTL